MKLYYQGFIILLMPFLAAACLKDKPHTDYAPTQPIITIPNSNWPVSAQSISDTMLLASAARDTLLLYAELSWGNTLNTDLRVSFQPDLPLITAYNDKWMTGYEVLPSTCYEIPSLTANIPANTHRVAIPVILFPDKMDPMLQYMLAFTIKDAEGKTIASTFRSMLFPLSLQP